MLFISIFIVLCVSQELPFNALDNYENLNAAHVRSMVKRGKVFLNCFTYINMSIKSCVVWSMVDRSQGYTSSEPFTSGGQGTFRAPNKCEIGIASVYCGNNVTLMMKLDAELRGRQFNITYGIPSNPNVDLEVLESLNLMPSIMVISW